MDTAKRDKLEAAGWRVGTAEDFLDLTPEEAAYVEVKILLSNGLKQQRKRREMTQTALARRIGSSQSRIAKAEAGDPGISVDLLLRALFAAGASPSDIARLISQRDQREAA